jgi:biotin carboxylase
MTVLCLASYFKGGDFLRQCRARGCRVILLVREKVRDEAWPHDSIDAIAAVPNQATPEVFVHAASELARHERLDRIVALEEYDVMTAALVREHLRIPGMGMTTARLFRDKLAMRVKAHAAGVPVPAFVHVLNADELRGFSTHGPGTRAMNARRAS